MGEHLKKQGSKLESLIVQAASVSLRNIRLHRALHGRYDSSNPRVTSASLCSVTWAFRESRDQPVGNPDPNQDQEEVQEGETTRARPTEQGLQDRKGGHRRLRGARDVTTSA